MEAIKINKLTKETAKMEKVNYRTEDISKG
jgi:hypothetical protein